ncbi:hypothetical protein ATE92_1279 [Ulvibacter sp. MAR_2010_11]|uniref:hypothetical protein n=1 Tax=Ulvibacter sp. MAR_2010_11 TaxID=1250229 RepID=UPI000C2B7DD0|nr:hypothetical protein [Ulvibacter sp. MAR_2010_11]PKA83131.1 hypothetical protein ATE92_1279 [Ulvibacter sp. MAR_2010_11]
MNFLTNFKPFPLFIISILGISLVGCSTDDNSEPTPIPEKIYYQIDGRKVFAGDPAPIELDLNSDGVVDYTIFAVLTANSNGDQLYVGINPIGANLIKSGPPNDNHFLNMGFLVRQNPNSIINNELSGNQIWTSDHSILVLRQTFNDGSTEYEGDWRDESETMVAIKHIKNQQSYYGWLNLSFDKKTEYITLVDYAYNEETEKSIKAGQKK